MQTKADVEGHGEKGTSGYLHKPGTFSGSWKGFSDLEKPEEKAQRDYFRQEVLKTTYSKTCFAAQHCLGTKTTHVTPTQPHMWIKSEEMHNSDLKSVLHLLRTTG